MDVYKAKNNHWYFSTCGLGKPQSALQTQFLIDHIGGIDSVFCVGAAGSLSPDIRPGDIVFATETVEHDHKEGFKKNSPLPRFTGSPKWIELAQSLSLNQCTFAPVASGDEDIVSEERSEQIRNQTQAVAVAWEGAGVARACRFNKTSFNEVRGISDFANVHAPQDFKKNLAITMSSLADVFIQFINRS